MSLQFSTHQTIHLHKTWHIMPYTAKADSTVIDDKPVLHGSMVHSVQTGAETSGRLYAVAVFIKVSKYARSNSVLAKKE